MVARPALMSRLLFAAVAGLAFLASAGSARADMVTFSGNTNSLPATAGGYDPVSFTGTVNVTGSGTTTATVTLTLTNNTSTGSAAIAGVGYITGFGFNLADGLVASASAAGNFKFLTPSSTVQTSLQGGSNDHAFSTSSTRLHTVTDSEITKGLTVNQSQTFTFTVTQAAGGIVNLSAADIVNNTSGSGKRLSVRFRSTNDSQTWLSDAKRYVGHDGPDGDKVEAGYVTPPTTPPDTTKPVPAPGGLVLAGMGFGCVMLGKLRRRKTA